ncbi:MAG: autotransporter assembly complex family protein [Hyphomonadaceae bacterium]
MHKLKAIPVAAYAAAGFAMGAIGPPAHADTPVILEGADDDARDAVARLLPDRERPTTLFEAERIAEEAAERASAWLRAEGYYQGAAIPQAEDNPPRAKVAIMLGPRFHFGPASIGYDGPAPTPAAQSAAADAVTLAAPGAPGRAEAVLNAEAAAVASLRRDGYADAEAGERRVVVDHADLSVTPAYQLRAGERVRLGELRADPIDLFRDDFLERVRNWREGDLFTPDHMAQLRRDMAATGAVARVSTRLEPRPGESGVRDVVLDIEPAKRRVFELGLGYSTTEGASIDVEWTRRNFSRRADTLTLAVTLAELKQGVTAELARPHAAGLGKTIHYTASAAREDGGPYVRTGVSLAAAIEAAQRLAYAVTYGASVSADTYTGAQPLQNALVLSGFGEVRRDTTGNPLDARSGEIVTLRLEPSISTGDATIGFARLTGDARVYHSFDDDLTLAGRVQAGWLSAFAGDENDTPPDRRFYAGGGGSVRGYSYNSIYPEARMAPGATPGGQGLFEVSGEARYRVAGPIGVAAFIDGGNAFDDLSEAADFKWGAGVGLRYDLGFAPLRVDIATPLNKSSGDPDFALYVSLGQAF